MKPNVLRWMGRIIVSGGVIVGVGWWFFLVPLLEVNSYNWNKDRSPHGFWRLKQRFLNLGCWTHDDGLVVGKLCGKEWVEPIVEMIARGEGMSCQGGHRDTAIEYITNHSPPEPADPTTEWPKWWAANKHKTQEDWIQDGFRAAGLQISKPASTEDMPKLLRIIGERAPPSNDWEKSHPVARHPDYLRYNAFRWLRDSGFDPVKFLLKSAPVTPDAAIEAGLSEYAEDVSWLQHGPVNPLSFATNTDCLASFAESRRPGGLQTRFHAIFSSVSIALVVIGLAATRCARGRRE